MRTQSRKPAVVLTAGAVVALGAVVACEDSNIAMPAVQRVTVGPAVAYVGADGIVQLRADLGNRLDSPGFAGVRAFLDGLHEPPVAGTNGADPASPGAVPLDHGSGEPVEIIDWVSDIQLGSGSGNVFTGTKVNQNAGIDQFVAIEIGDGETFEYDFDSGLIMQSVLGSNIGINYQECTLSVFTSANHHAHRTFHGEDYKISYDNASCGGGGGDGGDGEGEGEGSGGTAGESCNWEYTQIYVDGELWWEGDAWVCEGDA